MKDQIAVVTGGAQGIGLAVAKQLIDNGALVASWDVDPANDSAMSAFGTQGLAVLCDITDPQSVESTYRTTCEQLGTPAIVVNSAGIAGPNATVEDYDFEEWKKVFDVNVNGTFLVNKVCVPGMKAAGYGRILNIASVAGKE
ncbi:MAG: SDR family NAD(P)-dependent oxidoreductase, partial [Pseudomonadota bacterium]